VRGNVPTRIQKLDRSGPPGDGGWHGLILATAGLARLGLHHRITEIIRTEVMLPAIGQGALAAVARSKDDETRAVLEGHLTDQHAHLATTSERALLRRLEGGCQVPIGAMAQLQEGELHLEAAVVSLDGASQVRDAFSGDVRHPERLGLALAEHLLAQGADAILAAIPRHL
jgi:hydroxymethylbilane synthase